MSIRSLLALAVLWLAPAAVHAQVAVTHVVRITDSGFEPSQLEIKQGEAVVFINDGQDQHWPASDIHPTHGLYPEFDVKRGLAPGERWLFTFAQAGDWTMHDHLYPQFLGKITVIADPNAEPVVRSRPSISWWGRFTSRLRRVRYAVFRSSGEAKLSELNLQEVAKDDKAITYWVSVFGADALMQELLKDTGGGGLVDCHQEAHQVGRAAYVLYGAMAFAGGDASCHSGYYHGAMESMLFEKGTANLTDTVMEICNSFDTQFGIFECLHGIGHGLLAFKQYDLPAALDLCKTLPSSYDQTSCEGGAFMENIVTGQGIGAGGNTHTTPWLSDDPHFPCNAIDSSYDVQYQCYQMQTSWMLDIYDGDFARTAAECRMAREDMVNVCFSSLGRDAAGWSLRDPQKTIARCEAAERGTAQYDACIRGAVNVVIDFWGPALADQAAVFCKTAPEEGKSACFNTLRGRLHDVYTDPAKRTAACEMFEEPYRTQCLEGLAQSA